MSIHGAMVTNVVFYSTSSRPIENKKVNVCSLQVENNIGCNVDKYLIDSYMNCVLLRSAACIE